ncbi:hypothetical protein [Segetibacter aerophilus]|uniref:Uncharacterized protein n=1 Tax=Segetibacter aerophilus TaxID=670293 RepID=A0A512BBW9_9BACT|nr:hypothetical protein [Segetibacter aerophilus]GEO09424.1 hypothetical protein SAE01_19200 [Segetibacter aerophilus]
MKREKLQQLVHLVAGSITIGYGFEAFEKANFESASYYLALAILFLIVSGAHKWIGEKFIRGDVAINFLEAVTIIYAAYNYKNRAHEVFYYLMTMVGVGYLGLAIVNLFISTETKRGSSKRKKKRRRSSQLFSEQKLAESH